MTNVLLATVPPDMVVKIGDQHYFIDHDYSGGGKIGLIHTNTGEIIVLLGKTRVEVLCHRNEWATAVEPPDEYDKPTQMDSDEPMLEPVEKFEVTEPTIWENQDDDSNVDSGDVEPDSKE